MTEINIKDQFIDVPGGEIFTRSWVPSVSEARAPIVLLHESLGCVERWKKFPQLLCDATGREVIAYDRLGFGRSTAREELPSSDFITEEAEIYFPCVKEQLGISRYCLFGHSVGGTMAVAIGARDRGDCLAIVSESAQAFVEDMTMDGIRTAKERLRDPAAIKRLERAHGDKAEWVISAWTDVWLRPEFATWNIKSDLAEVRCPLLIIHGDRDDFGSIKFPETFRDHSGGPTQMEIIEYCGHVPHREYPELVLKLTSEFLGRAAQ